MTRTLVVDASVVVDLRARFRPQPLEDLRWAPGTVLVAPELRALRNNVTAYDAAYVILARLLKATLVTRDKRLAKAPGLSVQMVVP